MSDGTGLAEALLGLAGFRVLAVGKTAAEVVIDVETIVEVVGCASCGTRAEAQDRMPVAIRDLPCFGRPARLVWRKRRWRCTDVDCGAKTWTETIEQVSPRAVMTGRAGAEAGRQVGANARPRLPARGRARRVLVHGDERGHRARHAAGGRSRPGRPGRDAGRGRDLLAARQPPARHAVCHRGWWISSATS
jgi:zinc-finger of transposase IS204/IS1001/IS1096/IS1165